MCGHAGWRPRRAAAAAHQLAIGQADDQLLVNQHAYGVPAASSPVYHYRHSGDSEMLSSYLASFDSIWAKGVPSHG
jgi:hypothetical protein